MGYLLNYHYNPGFLSSFSDWSKQFEDSVQGLNSSMTYEESAGRLKDLVKSGLLKYTDIKENPEKFFQVNKLKINLVSELNSKKKKKIKVYFYFILFYFF